MSAASNADHGAQLAPRGAVRVHAVQVDRTPGIPEAFGVEALSPGLNLVFGPNASGKSSLLRALDALLWPSLDASNERAVRGALSDGTRSWTVRLDGTTHTAHTTDGARVDAPRWPSPALRHRLHFALHDLLSVSRDPDAFASAIMHASAGGLDVMRAGQGLGMLERAPRVLAVRRSHDDAVRAVAVAQQQQRSQHDERQALEQHRAARDAAREAAVQWQRVRAAQRWRAARARLTDTETALAALPTALADLRGHELEHARDLYAAWRDAHARGNAARAARARAESAQRAAFDGAPPTVEQRETWRRGLEALRRTDAALERARGRLAERRAARDVAAAALAPRDADSAPPVAPDVVAAAAAIATRLESARAAQVAAVAHAAMLDAAQEESSSLIAGGDRDALRDAVRVLVDWLDADATRRAPISPPARAMHWGLAVMAVIGWLVVARTWNLAGILLAVVTLAVAWWRQPRVDTRQRDEANARAVKLEARYAALDVPQPATWATASVIALLDVLARAVGDATMDARRRDEQRRADALATRAAEALRVQQADAAALAARTGLAPETDGRTLGWLLERLARWHDAHMEYRRAEAGWRDAQREHAEALQRFADASGTPSTLVEVDAMVAAREQRWEAYAAASNDAAQATDDARHAEAECDRLAAGWDALFRTVHTNAPTLAASTTEQAILGALSGLEALLAKREQWAVLMAVRADALRELGRVRESTDDVAHFDALCALPDAALAEQSATLHERAETFEACVQRVAALEQRLQLAAQSHAVQDALALRAATRDAVLAEWTHTVCAVITHTLVTQLQRETRDVQRPAVFHRARALFGRITRGRWRLHIDEHEGAAHFRAEDTVTGVHHALDTLSAGTRVQLLVAVRVAFVESEETDGVQLPLFFDETLGTSDDERASALIDAVLTLVADGRQVFYVTAQRDEVQKWHAALAARDGAVQWRDIDLVKVRRLAPLPEPVRIPAPVPERTVPDDALQSHAAFGAALPVRPIDPARTPAVRWPLWYLTDDVPLLHSAWQLGIEHWGELAGYREAGGTLHVAGRTDAEVAVALAELSHVAELAEQLHALSAIGTGRTVDRRALQETGVVTAAFLDAIVAQAEVAGGDAMRLLAALEAGVVPRFGAARVEPLRAALRRGGWLAETMSLSGDEIRWGVIARSAREDAADLVDALLERLRRGAALAPELSHASRPP